MAIDIQWKKKFEVGHPRIDQQHRMFLELIRNISHASERQQNKEWCIRLLRETKKFAEFHFYSEENIMLEMGYPDYAGHQQLHADLLTALDERVHAYISERINLEAILVFLIDWFAQHTSIADKKMAKFMNLLPHADEND